MMPRAARHVVVAMQVAMGEDVESGAVLIADDCGEGVLEFFAKADIHHAGVERAAHMLSSNQRGGDTIR